MATALYALGKKDLAIEHYRKALARSLHEHARGPTATWAPSCSSKAGRMKRSSITCEAVRFAPDWDSAYHNLGVALERRGQFAEAIEHYEHALKSDPRSALIERDLGIALSRLGKFGPAAEHLRRAVELEPANLDLAAELSWMLATCPQNGVRDGAKAVELARKICEATRYTNLQALNILAAAYAEAGKFAEAEDATLKALSLIPTRATPLERELRQRLQIYRSGNPYRDVRP